MKTRRTFAATMTALAMAAVAVPMTATPAAAGPRQAGYTVYASTLTACNAELRHARKQLSGQMINYGKCYRNKTGWYAQIIYRVR